MIASARAAWDQLGVLRTSRTALAVEYFPVAAERSISTRCSSSAITVLAITRVRFALPERGSGKLLELEFDQEAGQFTRSQEVEVVPSVPPPGRGPP